MPGYLNLTTFKDLSLMPSVDLDALETVQGGWIEAQLELYSAKIDARLRKRYAAPFSTPYPVQVTGWLAALVTMRCYLKRGVDATDQQYADIKADADAANAEILEAANGETGLFDLPLRANTTTTGITKGAPMVYTESSPYVQHDVQAAAAHDEDANGVGTGG